MLRPRLGERGAGALNFVITAVVLLVLGVGLMEYLPAQNRRSKLVDYMVEQTQTAIRTPPKTIEKRLYDQALEWEVPVDRKDIHVAKSAGRIIITASYVEPLNFFVYEHAWKIDIRVDRPIFQF
jgi:hypothetical protein